MKGKKAPVISVSQLTSSCKHLQELLRLYLLSDWILANTWEIIDRSYQLCDHAACYLSA